MNEAWLVNDAIPCEGVNASACIEQWSKTSGPTNQRTDSDEVIYQKSHGPKKLMNQQTDGPVN